MLTFGVFVTESGGSHVTEAQGALAAAVHKQVAVVRVELGCCYDLRQILHVGWLDVHNILETCLLGFKHQGDGPTFLRVV